MAPGVEGSNPFAHPTQWSDWEPVTSEREMGYIEIVPDEGMGGDSPITIFTGYCSLDGPRAHSSDG